ncbi:MAG: DUF547 domain-containing protein [Ginsengibacter sp.]
MKLFFLSSLFTIIFATAYPQRSYTEGNKVADFQFTKILNNPNLSSSLNQIKSKLTIIDFFGTWCIPCIKALPHLEEIQNEFKDKVAVILVSNEAEEKLTKFINVRAPFPFPVVVDKENSFIDLFQPPSYPYTVVMDRDARIIAVTDAVSLSKADISKWLAQKNEPVIINTSNEIKHAANIKNVNSANSLVKISQQFIYAAKTGENTDSLISALKNLSYDDLVNKLSTDDEKKAFWINLYNGFTQTILKKSPEKYKSRNQFFKSKEIEVAGKLFSLDDIEHGILRRSKIKWSLGHVNKFFPDKTEKDLRVKDVDYRIHFTLNCGAKSCPPIAYYNSENLNRQLDLATKSYLSSEGEYDAEKDVVYLPAFMSWFRSDFGGKKKVKKLLKKINVIPSESNPKIKYKKYDWNLFLDNYTTDN